jgi:ADP-dependent NAD(P)H-hydrate dehydratase / NAD(P)H-hydrate epimerase
MAFTLNLEDDGTTLRPTLTPPDANLHKYSRGHAMVWSGPPLRTGASRLSAQAALAVGAGLVTIIGDRAALTEQAAHVTAIMLREADAELSAIDDRVTALAIGPGAGNDIADIVCQFLDRGLATVLDADAITAFEADSLRLFKRLDADDVITPHAGEFARLFPDISLHDRSSAASLAARRSGAVVLFKGSNTYIAAPDGRVAINRHASPWLATAGSGDVLTGLVCGLLAQSIAAFDAACIAAWLHGDIGIRGGPGLTADRMVGLIPLVLQACLDDANTDGAGSRT